MLEALTVEIPYTVDTGEALVNESFGPKTIHGRRSGTVELKTIRLLNGRALGERHSPPRTHCPAFVAEKSAVIGGASQSEMHAPPALTNFSTLTRPERPTEVAPRLAIFLAARSEARVTPAAIDIYSCSKTIRPL